MIDELLIELANQSPVIVLVLIIIWLSLPTLAERFAIIGKLVKPLSKRWREKAEKLERQQNEHALTLARQLARQAMQEMTPPDVAEMERRMKRMDDTLDLVQDAENLLRAYVIYDELWHFHDDHSEARRGRVPAHRIAFDTFEEKWKQGWRPFDDAGKLVDDGSGDA
jgi:hypothetical protein